MTLRFKGYVELPKHTGQGGFDHAAVHTASGHVYVAHTANDAIDVFDPAAGRYLHSVAGLAGVAGALVSDEDNLILSSNRAGNTIGIFAPGANPTVRYAEVGVRPNGLAYDHRRKLVLAANVGEPYTLSMIHLATGVRTEIAVPGRTRWSVYDAGLDRFFVNIMAPSQIVVVDSELDQVERIIDVPHAGAHGLDFDPATNRLFCACDAGMLVALDAASGKVLAEEKLSGVPDVVWFNAKRRQLYVAVGDPGVVDMFATDPLRRLDTVKTERGAHTTAYSAATQQLHVFLPQTHRAATYEIADG